MIQSKGNNLPKMFPAKDGQRGDILVHGLFQRGFENIVNVQVADADAACWNIKH
jgi:hypothetical protein